MLRRSQYLFLAFNLTKTFKAAFLYHVVFHLSEDGSGIAVLLGNILIGQCTKRYPDRKNYRRIFT